MVPGFGVYKGLVVVLMGECGLSRVSILRICDIGCQLRGDVCKKKILVQLFDLPATIFEIRRHF